MVLNTGGIYYTDNNTKEDILMLTQCRNKDKLQSGVAVLHKEYNNRGNITWTFLEKLLQLNQEFGLFMSNPTKEAYELFKNESLELLQEDHSFTSIRWKVAEREEDNYIDSAIHFLMDMNWILVTDVPDLLKCAEEASVCFPKHWKEIPRTLG